MVISLSLENATGQPGCQEYLTCERCRIRETCAVNTCERSCLGRGTADGALAGAGRVCEPAGRVGELAGRCGDAAGPPQLAQASASTAASTAGTTTARILVMPAQPTRPAGLAPRRAGGTVCVPAIMHMSGAGQCGLEPRSQRTSRHENGPPAPRADGPFHPRTGLLPGMFGRHRQYGAELAYLPVLGPTRNQPWVSEMISVRVIPPTRTRRAISSFPTSARP
jgi:hypothetical protein